ncbi:electron transport complex subunit RsxC [Candidatus Omnitrophota bacterium]
MSFKGGVHPPGFKNLSKDCAIRPISPPRQVTIPLVQHIGTPCVPQVKIGDEVKRGMVIGDSEKFISCPVHASISGKVKAIKKFDHPVTRSAQAIVIESDGKDEYLSLPSGPKQDMDNITPDKIRQIVKDAGIVGMGGAAFPTHVKLTPPKHKKIDTFILNGAECEPYLTCDERVMIEKADQVLKGALLIMKTLELEKGYVAIEDNKPAAIRVVSEAIRRVQGTGYRVQIKVLHTKYPQGGEKQLIKAVVGREVPPGGLPFDVGCKVGNVQTALAIYKAVYEAKPLYERVITVTGDAIKEPSNLLVRIGTNLSHIIEQCGGLHKDLGKIISGGPMMGIAQFTSDIPVIKGTSGILLLSADSAKIFSPEYCIRCGKCIESCPVNLMPSSIVKAAEYNRFDIAGELNAADCIECGCCSYVCPSKIPLVQYIKHAKRRLLCPI